MLDRTGFGWLTRRPGIHGAVRTAVARAGTGEVRWRSSPGYRRDSRADDRAATGIRCGLRRRLRRAGGCAGLPWDFTLGMIAPLSEPSAQPVQLLIALEARQYAAMLRRILEEHGKGATIRIDDNCFGEQDVPRLLEEWCTDRAIGRTSSFRLERGGNVLFGFDDYDPSEAWADISVIDFAERLRQEGIAQYRVHPVQASLLTEPVGSLLRALWNRLLRKPMSRR